MKPSVCLGALALSISSVAAFPAIQQQALEAAIERDLKKYAADPVAAADEDSLVMRVLREKERRKKRAVTFDASSQYVETTGAHAFIPPDLNAGDQRGPCPGLNALANHNYLPHNGVATIGEFIDAVETAYGMAVDLGTFLAVYGTVFDGNPISLTPGYSIGGPTSANENILGNLLGLTGQPQGLSGSHNKYEADTSPVRGDLYLYGNDYESQIPQFQQYYNALVEGEGADAQYDALYDFRVARFDDSVSRNPYFFFSPFAGVLVSPAGFSFPVRMMSNKSEEFPEGSLSKEVLMGFYAMDYSTPGSEYNFTYQVGWERMPENFYKRAIGDEYTIAGFLLDVLDFGIKDPRLLSVAGNTGTVDSLTPVDIGSLTKGVFDSATLLQGNNLECFIFQAIQAAGPDVTANPESAIGAPLSNTILNVLSGLGCPQLQSIDQSQYDIYPGYEKSGGAI